MSIIHVRIDDRLIHGQVATMWTSNLNATRIMVIDDEVANDDVTKMSLKLATPSGVSLSVLPVEKALQRFIDNAYEGQRVFVIVKSPETLYRLVTGGLSLDRVNIGNLTLTKNRTKVSQTVAISELELEQLKFINKKGIEITLQLIPSNPIENFFDVVGK